MDLSFFACLKISGHKIRQQMTNPRLKKNAAKFTTFAFKVLKLEKASHSYRLRAKANLEPASTTPQ